MPRARAAQGDDALARAKQQLEVIHAAFFDALEAEGCLPQAPGAEGATGIAVGGTGRRNVDAAAARVVQLVAAANRGEAIGVPAAATA